MTAQEMWERYSRQQQIAADFEAWSFGDDADTLAQLVLDGIKTATCSAYPLYALEGEELPKAGEYSVILDSRDEAVCIIKTTKVYIMPYEAVTADHARKEGEGDRTLDYWREVHEAFFKAELAEAGLTFDPKLELVCEEFTRVYP